MKLALGSVAGLAGFFRGGMRAVVVAGAVLLVCGAAAALETRPLTPEQAARLGVPASAPASTQQFVYTVKEGEAAQTVGPVAVGQKIQIRAAGNASTGFGWTVKEIKGEAVKSGGDVGYLLSPTFPSIPANGGTFYIPLEPVKAGKAEVTLVYTRTWGKDAGNDAALTSSVTLTIEVHDAAAGAATSPSTAPATGPASTQTAGPAGKRA